MTDIPGCIEIKARNFCLDLMTPLIDLIRKEQGQQSGQILKRNQGLNMQLEQIIGEKAEVPMLQEGFAVNNSLLIHSVCCRNNLQSQESMCGVLGTIRLGVRIPLRA